MLTSVFLQDAVIAVVGPVDDFGLRIESRTPVSSSGTMYGG